MAQEPLDASTIASRILTELSKTQFACSSLVPLSGGVGNFVYKAQLRKPLDDGTAEVVVKHGEGFAAQFPTLKLPMFRCVSFNELSLGDFDDVMIEPLTYITGV